MLFADMETGGWVCLGVFALAVIVVVNALKSAGETASKLFTTAFEANPEATTEVAAQGLWYMFFGND
jgi:hypothetical protein